MLYSATTLLDIIWTDNNWTLKALAFIFKSVQIKFIQVKLKARSNFLTTSKQLLNNCLTTTNCLAYCIVLYCFLFRL